jgi:hypothetical protein
VRGVLMGVLLLAPTNPSGPLLDIHMSSDKYILASQK